MTKVPTFEIDAQKDPRFKLVRPTEAARPLVEPRETAQALVDRLSTSGQTRSLVWGVFLLAVRAEVKVLGNIDKSATTGTVRRAVCRFCGDRESCSAKWRETKKYQNFLSHKCWDAFTVEQAQVAVDAWEECGREGSVIAKARELFCGPT